MASERHENSVVMMVQELQCDKRKDTTNEGLVYVNENSNEQN